jgi:rod shape-determining protein MreC
MLLVLVAVSLGIIALDKFDEEKSVTGLLTRPFSPFLSLSSRIMETLSVHTQNQVLRSNLVRVSRESAALREQVQEIERLRSLLGFTERREGGLIASRVVHEFETRAGGGIVLDKGTRSRVDKNMTVVAPGGLVGRVMKVSAYASLVRRLIDPGFRVSAMTQRTRATGIVVTGNSGRLLMEWVSPNAEVARGDTVISSGMGPITPKGIPIGRVVGIREEPEEFSMTLEVEPFTDFRRLEEVFVIDEKPVDYEALFEERGKS